MNKVLVWRCCRCGCCRDTGPLPPDQPLPVDWAFIDGGMTHRCSVGPAGEVDGTQVWAFHKAQIVLLEGDEAELWELEGDDEDDGDY